MVCLLVLSSQTSYAKQILGHRPVPVLYILVQPIPGSDQEVTFYLDTGTETGGEELSLNTSSAPRSETLSCVKGKEMYIFDFSPVTNKKQL